MQICMHQTDIIIVGAGPVGLFTVFEAGLLQLKCHLIDSLPQIGGQLSEIYPRKPIYDIPGIPSILAKDLVDNLWQQIAPFNPEFTLGERAEKLERLEDNNWVVTTSGGTKIKAPVVAIAAGLGAFEPRKPPLTNITRYEGKGIEYFVRDPEKFTGKKVLIAGGGDSALDWSIGLANRVKKLWLVHRRSEFRGAPKSVAKVHELANRGKIEILTNSQVTGLQGNGRLESVVITQKEGNISEQVVDYFIPLFGLTPKLGPIATWNLELDKSGIIVNTLDYQTNIPGIYAIGDINSYPGKLKLILCGFHEATLMVQSAFKRIHPDQKLSFKYTTVMGEQGILKKAESL